MWNGKNEGAKKMVEFENCCTFQTNAANSSGLFVLANYSLGLTQNSNFESIPSVFVYLDPGPFEISS